MPVQQFILNSGDKPLSTVLSWQANGVAVSNYSAQWLNLGGNRYAAPTSRGTFRVDSDQVINVQWGSPGTVVQPTAVAGQFAIVTFTTDPLTDSGGALGGLAASVASVTTLERFAKANIPASAVANAGRLISLTDYDQSVWVDTGTVFASVSSEVFDVVRLGAKGNNTGDDGAIINNALNAASGAIALLPMNRTYRTTTTVSIPQFGTLLGQGPTSIISYAGVGDAVKMDPGNGIQSQWRSRMQNLRVTTTTGAAGLHMKDIYEAWIDSNIIDGFSNANVLCDLTAGQAMFAIEITNNRIMTGLGTGRGIRMIGANAHNRYYIAGNRIQGNLGAGIACDMTAKSFAIIGNDIEGNVGQELNFANGCDGAFIGGCHFETNSTTTDAIVLAGGNATAEYNGITITGNAAFANTGGTTAVFLKMTSIATNPYHGVVVNGNRGSGYAFGIDFGSKKYIDCNFTSNWWTMPYHTNVPGSASIGSPTRVMTITPSIAPGAVPLSSSLDSAAQVVTGAIYSRPNSVSVTPMNTNNAAGPIAALETGLTVSGYVDTDGNVKVRWANCTVGNITPIARDYQIVVTTY